VRKARSGQRMRPESGSLDTPSSVTKTTCDKRNDPFFGSTLSVLSLSRENKVRNSQARHAP
jgi:hypothetical protein